MTWLEDLPVQRKLGFAMLLTSTIVLVIACIVFLTVEYYGYRNSLIRTVATLARVTADNSTAAMAFADKKGATQNLEALRADPQIVCAVLYDLEGRIFAQFIPNPEEVVQGSVTAPTGVRLEHGYVIGVQPVIENSRRLGILYVQASMDQIYERMRTYALGVLGVLILSFALAWLLASLLRHILARPILALANTAEAVSTLQDYSLRARQYGRDELGRLTETFNEMLGKTHAAIGALQESEWSHRELVRALPTAAYMCDVQGRITIYNEAAVTLWGRAPELGLESWCGSYKIYRPDGTPLPLDQCPMAVSLREGRPVRGEEILVERPDGTRRNVMPHPQPIRDTGGNMVGIVNMLVDITEQKKADAAVRQLAAIVESSDDAIIGKDLEGIITTWNRGAELLYGYTAAEIIGRPVAVLIPDDRPNEEPSILARIRRDERIEHYETVRRRKDGSRIDISLTVSSIKDADGKIIGASKIARDITERKRDERHANFLSQLSQTLSNVGEPDEIIRIASRAVGLYVGANRCYFGEFDEGITTSRVRVDWAQEGLSSLKGTYNVRDFGKPEMYQTMAAGPLIIADVASYEPAREFCSGYEQLGIRSLAATPYFNDGPGRSVLVVTSGQPRIWREDEIDLLENAASRVWPLIEEARGQQALRESERRQRELMQTLPVACYTVDEQGRLTFFNEAAVQLWGRLPEVGRTRWSGAVSFSCPDGTPVLHENSPVALALKEKRRIRGTEIIIQRPDGSRRWTVHHPDPLLDAEGRCVGVINVVMDVTEERTAHEKVQKAAEHLNLAIASANLGDWSWDATTDIITLSPRTSEIYGVPGDPSLTRSGMRKLLHEEDQERARQALQQAMEGRTDYDIDYRVNRPDGTQRWVAAKGRCLLDARGKVSGMVGVVQDITERKRIEETLRQHEAQLRLVTDNAPVLLVRTDREHRYTFVNRAYAERNGFSNAAELIGMKVTDVVGVAAYERIKPYIDQALAGTRVEFELEIPYANLSRRWIHVIYVPERDAQEQVTGLLGVITDIDARKQSENELKRARDEAVAASRAKDDFLAALSHELRTPLNPVLLLASAAASNPELPPVLRDDFELIRKNVALEARLIDDLLDLTRITRGKLQLELHRCDLHSVLQDALVNVKAELLEKRLHLVVECGAGESIVSGDSVRLQQILWNILKNAVKFTPEDGKITVETSSAGQMLTIKVTDTGIGMVPEEIDRVFQAFSQGEHAIPGAHLHRFGGLGLGLTISRMLVELHGGKIQAVSAGRDQGATFVVELPLWRGPTGERTELKKPATRPRANSVHPLVTSDTLSPFSAQVVRRRILLVEDHAPTRLTLLHLLKCRHFEVTPASSAADAHQLALAAEFDLIISDVGLPDRNGYELMTELRSLKPGLIGIALSGYGMEEDLNRSQAAGFSVHLVKPITIGVLEEAIARVLPSSHGAPTSTGNHT